MVWLVLFVVVGMESDAADGLPAGSVRRCATANFQVECLAARQDARQIAQACEGWRAKLLATWRPDQKPGPWKIRCEVVVHATRQSYLAAVGRGGASSFGSSYLDFSGQSVSRRRVDLLADAEGELSALGHEMTHVVIADYLGGKQLPRWADEGMAILADSFHKRRLHQRDLEIGLARTEAFNCVELLTLGDYPPRNRIPAFYGQSAAVVAFLCQREKPAKFLDFIARSAREGNDAALRDVYGIAGVQELEQLWRRDLASAVNFHNFRLTLAD